MGDFFFAGTLVVMFTERLSLVDAVYFSIVTIATVGYGDIHPNAAPGKLLAIVLVKGGVGIFLGVVANASEMLIDRREQPLRTQKLHYPYLLSLAMSTNPFDPDASAIVT